MARSLKIDLNKFSWVTGMDSLSDPLLIVFSKCDSIEKNVMQFKVAHNGYSTCAVMNQYYHSIFASDETVVSNKYSIIVEIIIFIFLTSAHVSRENTLSQ